MTAWSVEASIVLFFCALLIAKKILQKNSIFFAVIFSYVAFSALRVYALPWTPWVGEEPTWVIMFEHSAQASLIQVLLMVAAVFCLKPDTWIKLFQWIAVINAAWICTGWYGVLLNDSMSGCFSAVLLPLLFINHRPLWQIGLVTASLFVAHQSLPLFCGFFLLFMLGLQTGRYLWTILTPCIALGVGFLALRSTLFDGRGRYNLWEMSMSWWVDHANGWIGTGSGSYHVIGPYLTHELGSIFTFLHSDWLQILFEQGVIGVVLALILFLKVLLKARGALLFSAATCGIWMVANMPMRYPLSAFYLVVLIRVIYSAQDPKALKDTRKFLASYPVLQQMFLRWQRLISLRYRLEWKLPWISSLVQARRTRQQRIPECQVSQL